MAEYDAGTVKATMTADSSGAHVAVERVKKDYKDLAQAIADAMRIVKKEETEANKVERERQREIEETARKAREAAQTEKQAAQEKKEAYRDLGLAAGVSFAAITAAIWKSTQANNQLKASMAGLDSVATGNIGSYNKIKKELQQIQSDGLIPLTNATQAYKNLISRYQDEDTAIKMFHKIADAAAFGRQAHLSLGEAIQGTSEGLKNEMSNMTDNGGITKNLSLMWKDYAAQIGKTVGELTEAEKRQAEVNGFMEEGKFQTGDLAKLQQQLSGQMSKASAETTMAAAAMGDALEPAMGTVVGQFSGLMSGVKEFIHSSPGMVAGITTGAAAMSGLVAVTSAWIALDAGAKIAAGFSALTGPVGLTLIALSALAAVVVGVKTEMAKAREEHAKLADSYRDQSIEVNDLISEYESLKSKTKLTTEEKKRMLEVSNKIAEILPQAATGYDNEGNAIIDVNTALKEMIILKGQEFKLREEGIKDEVKDLEGQKKREESRRAELNKTWEMMKSRWQVSDVNQIEDPLLRKRAKELEQEYNSELRKTKDEINRLGDTIDFKKDQINYINDMLNGKITRQTITGPKNSNKNDNNNDDALANQQKVKEKALEIEKDWNDKLFDETHDALERLNKEEQDALSQTNLTEKAKRDIREYYADQRLELERETAEDSKAISDAANQRYEVALESSLEDIARDEKQSRTDRLVALANLYDIRQKRIDEAYEQEKIAAIGNKEALIAIEKTYELDSEAARQDYLKKQSKLDKQYQAQTLRDLKMWLRAASELIDMVSDLYTKYYSNKSKELDNWYAKQQEAIENSITDETAKNEALKALEDDYNQKKNQIAKEQAEKAKTAAIFDAIIKTAQSVMQALAAYPPPVSFIMAAAAAAAGAIQVKLIKDEPVPELAEGAIATRATNVLIGEGKYQEAVLPLSNQVLAKIGAGIAQATNTTNNSSLTTNNSSNSTVNYINNINVGTLIADESSKKKLAREISEYQIAEAKRRGLR